ncbi:xyloglucan galactosyltransferase XLT2-like [Chenopodium quinoa]|uniref:xyloglucan galactosyltransferase XLT2-like n=1 Tax=Chenopodium quinoa TaxID=63459 RepID=UPI000B78AF27|nr:xyloglucan galactosyltransferase XLT2-like [Chenopodium quinoa]
MLPVTDTSLSSTQDRLTKRPKTPPKQIPPFSSSPDYFSKPSHFTFSLLYHHPRSCLLIFVLLLQLILLSYSGHRPLSAASSTTLSVAISNSSTLNPNSLTCESGKFFVYDDLPPKFNSEIYHNCDKLSPWGSRCAALSNDGFGRKATGINRIMPENLADAWYFTDQFSSEILFHNRLLSHECRTLDPESAAAYYIPFYAGLAVGKYLWSDYSPKDRDQHCEMMLKWVQEKHPYFNRSNGWDHFLVMGRITWDFRRSNDQDWGSKCIYLPSMRNITRLLIEKNPWDYFDVGVPYPTGFHPSNPSDVVLWQEFVRSRERRSLFCFAGATRGMIANDFRGVLLNQCRKSGGSCRVVDCGGNRCANGTSEILETFLDSEFCLQPRGDSFTRRSIFDCMLAGSIPVFFWRRSAYYQYEWFLPGEPESYSVFIHRDEVKNGTLVKSVLEKYSKEDIKRMRDKVVEFIPKFIYAKSNEGLGSIKDAVDVAVDGVLKRMKELQEYGFKW